jgi:hypothetical protein
MRAVVGASPTVDAARAWVEGGGRDPLRGAEAPALGPWALRLDGRWRFARYGRPEAVPQEVLSTAYDDKGWAALTVPGAWPLQGFDAPHYTNVQMPFPEAPPEVPEDNATGVYRRRFRWPRAWRGGQVTLELGSAESVVFVYLNGAYLGFSKDSRLPAHFDAHFPSAAPGKMCLRSWWCATAMAAGWRIRTTGGWPGSSQRSPIPSAGDSSGGSHAARGG